MKPTLLFLLFLLTGNIILAKGTCGHGHAHYSGAHHSSVYRPLDKLRDSTFTGYVVLRKDTLRGQLSDFNSYEFKLTQSNGEKRHITYHAVQVMHLDEASGPVQLTQTLWMSGFFRELINNDSLALYDRQFLPHKSLADVDTSDLYFRYKDFSRPLKSDFTAGLRKRIVPILNTHYSANVSRETRPTEVYQLMESQQ